MDVKNRLKLFSPFVPRSWKKNHFKKGKKEKNKPKNTCRKGITNPNLKLKRMFHLMSVLIYCYLACLLNYNGKHMDLILTYEVLKKVPCS